MVNKLYKELSVQNLANSIRNKTGKTNKMTLEQMANEVDSLKPLGSLDGLSNGYDVMFYDEFYNGLAFYSIKAEHTIKEPPIYECRYWKKEDGTPITFPLTPVEDMILYPHTTSLVATLYDHYDIDNVLYPYVTIIIKDAGPNRPKDSLYIIFGNQIKYQSGSLVFYNSPVGENSNMSSILNSIDMTDIDTIVNLVIANIPTLTSQSIVMASAIGTYTNFEHTATSSEVKMLIE